MSLSFHHLTLLLFKIFQNDSCDSQSSSSLSLRTLKAPSETTGNSQSPPHIKVQRSVSASSKPRRFSHSKFIFAILFLLVCYSLIFVVSLVITNWYSMLNLWFIKIYISLVLSVFIIIKINRIVIVAWKFFNRSIFKVENCYQYKHIKRLDMFFL